VSDRRARTVTTDGDESGARRAPLGRTVIVAAAVTVADAEGVRALSMRRLARSLGYEVMSLYNHVANKDELLSSMVEAVVAEVDPADPDGPPLEAVRTMAVATRGALGRHPWAAELWLRYLPGPERTRLMDDFLRLLDGSGLSPDLAHHGFHAVTNHVVGYTLQEVGMTQGRDDPVATAEAFLAGIPADTYPYMVAHVRQHLDGNTASSFELVLDLILDGLVRLNASR
jgi:AcrR family transcriptional regulator